MFWRFGLFEARRPVAVEELVEGGVDAPGAGEDRFGQGVDVGALQLRGLAVGEHVGTILCSAWRARRGSARRSCTGRSWSFWPCRSRFRRSNRISPTCFGELRLNRRAGGLVDGLSILGHAGGELFAGLGEGGGIDHGCPPSPSRTRTGSEGGTRSRGRRAPARTRAPVPAGSRRAAR
jgi:hypothetical protein